MTRRAAVLTALSGLCLVAGAYILTSLGNKGSEITFEWNWPALWLGDGAGTLKSVIGGLRAPHVVAAVLAGAALSVAGLLLQGVSRNPLADPFLLGISGGAGLAVVILHAVPGLIAAVGWWVVPVAAFAGAQLATLLVLSLARGPSGKTTMLGLILGGVIINSFCAAGTTFLLTGFAPGRLRITTMWLAGGVGYAGWGQIAICAVVIVGCVIFIRLQAAHLNAFALGEEGASLVGVDAMALLRRSAWTASLLTGTAVALAGMVGYVGLIIPHLVRLAVGSDFRSTLLFSALGGALLLVAGDGVARTIMSPQEIPVGVLAALVGTPALLLLLRRELGGKDR